MASEPQVVATLIGDVVGSRSSGSRAALHADLAATLDRLNDELDPVVPFRITIGDEYQGCFAEVGQALIATLRIRLALLPEVDVRHGVGWGGISVLAESPRVEDGPGWWAARAAIDSLKTEERTGLREVRTAYAGARDVDGPDEEAVNAALLLRDHLVSGLSPRSLGVLRGLLAGRTQKEIAEAEGVSPSAISQRVRNDGVAAVLAADKRLGRVR